MTTMQGTQDAETEHEDAAVPPKQDRKSRFSFNFTKQIGIRYNLFGAIGTMALLAIIAAGVGIYSLSEIRTSFDDLANRGISAVAGASGLAVQSNRVANAAVNLAEANEEYDRSSAHGELVQAINDLETQVKKHLDTYASDPKTADTSGLKVVVADLKKSLDELDAATKARLAAATRKQDNLAELFREHEEISRSFVPIIDDAYFDAVITGERLLDAEGEVTVEEMTDKQAQLKAALEADSTLHQLVALLVRGALTDDETAIVPQQDRVSALAAKFSNSVEALGDAGLSAKVVTVSVYADADSGLLPDRREELIATEKSTEILSEMFFLADQLSNSIDSMIRTQSEVAHVGASVVDALMSRNQMLMALVGAVSVVLVGLIAYFIVHRGLTLRLERLIAIMRRLADGDVDFDFPKSTSRDEIGDIARAVEVFRDNAGTASG